MKKLLKFEAFASLAVLAMLAAPVMAQESFTDGPKNPRESVPASRDAAAASGETGRVFGGLEAEPGKWPFQVALLDSGRLEDDPETQYNAQFCGGSLIAPQWVLTAAHCVADNSGTVYDASTNTVLVGSTKLNSGKRHIAAEVYAHEDYNPMTIENDVALLKLREPVTDITPVKLVDSALNTDTGKATLLGWGLTENGSTPNDLLQAEIGLFPNATCNAGIKGYFRAGLEQRIRENASFMKMKEEAIQQAVAILDAGMGDPLGEGMLCAGTQTGEKSSCNGDSGGPLVVTGSDGPVQVGVVSWGSGPLDATSFCGHADAYAVYTRVAKYRDWIASKMGG